MVTILFQKRDFILYYIRYEVFNKIIYSILCGFRGSIK